MDARQKHSGMTGRRSFGKPNVIIMIDMTILFLRTAYDKAGVKSIYGFQILAVHKGTALHFFGKYIIIKKMTF